MGIDAIIHCVRLELQLRAAGGAPTMSLLP
jgi:hypothetical protein